MDSIKIKRNSSLKDIEYYFKQLHNYINQKEKVNLELPRRIDKLVFPMFSEILQLAINWVRYDIANRLIISISDNPNKNELNDLYRQEFIYPIITLCWNDISIVNSNGKKIRSLLRTKQNDFFLSMKKNLPIIGDKLLLVNADHFHEGLGILPTFELNGEFLVDQSQFKKHLKPPLLSLVKSSKPSQHQFDKIYEDVSAVIYELMKNTWEWGKKDNDNVPLSPSIRGLYARFYKKKAINMIEDFVENKPLVDYIKQDQIDVNEVGEIYMLEITVFDSGIGLIEKNKPATKIEDKDIIKLRLLKHHTSAEGIFKKKKGLGLDRVLHVLDEKGFIRIKTDKYCSYRDLIKDRYLNIAEKNPKNMILRDWSSSTQEEFKLNKYLHGSSISILYPLKYHM